MTIEVAFKVAGDSGEARTVPVRIGEPVRNPAEHKWPWAVTVDVDGRPYTTYGQDPLDAIENASQHAARLLQGVHGEALEPPLRGR